MKAKRSAGLLLPISSLPSLEGIGDLGPAAYRFIDVLKENHISLWQILPINPTRSDGSPYSAMSAFAGNPLLINVHEAFNFLKEVDIDKKVSDSITHMQAGFHQGNSDLLEVDYPLVSERKKQALQQVFLLFKKIDSAKWNEKFRTFKNRQMGWLADWSLFAALSSHFGHENWLFWEEELKNHSQVAINKFVEKHPGVMEYHSFVQFLFFHQWEKLRNYAMQNKVQIVGDVPIYISHSSADVWGHPHLFKLNSRCKAQFRAGVPPEKFSSSGQLWDQNPVFNWVNMRKEKFNWWIRRFRQAFSLFDYIRIDHFRGFVAYFEIPAKNKTAIKGKWRQACGREVFDLMQKEMGEMPIIAEDLGVITPPVIKLRDRYNFLGMRILQFGFDPPSRANKNLPHHYEKNQVVYTGTHDNNTCLGFWEEEATHRQKDFALKYLKGKEAHINWDMMTAALKSAAIMAIFPLQDILDMNGIARFNYPGTKDGNWVWRFSWKDLTEERLTRLKELINLTERNGSHEN